jgi:hypothetical protein
MDDKPRLNRNGGLRRKGEHSSNRKLKGGTNREYLLARLDRDGRQDLVAAIHGREISAYAAAVEAGYVRRRKTAVVEGDHNLTRWRKHRMAEALDRAPAAASYHNEQLPCFACRQPQAWKALAEVADTYLRARRGEARRASTSGLLPMSCCRRRPASVDSLIA